MKTIVKNTLIIALLMIGMGTTQAQTPKMGNQTLEMLEQSPAGSKIIEFIKVINTAAEITDDHLEALISEKLTKKYGKVSVKQQVFEDLQANDGKITVYKVDRVETGKYEVYAKGSIEPDVWLKFDFFVEDGTPPFSYSWQNLDNTFSGTGNISNLNEKSANK